MDFPDAAWQSQQLLMVLIGQLSATQRHRETMQNV
tara:strand:- start:471 stop:575 length:105 start_codon:yes stop_codon:yes gene_type:complete